MKTMRIIFMGIMLHMLTSISLFAQSEPEILAVTNEADWCSTCQHNGERAMKTFKANNKGDFQFVMNDLTSDKTKESSLKKLKELGLENAMSGYKGTGMVYFFNAKTKVLVGKVSIAKSDDELVKAMNSANKSAHGQKSSGCAKDCASKGHSCG
jgi:hypothetical protein